MRFLQLLILILTIISITTLQCNATTGNYLSSHSLGKQDEMFDALQILCKQIKIPNTTLTVSRTVYTIFNLTIKCIYNDGKQTADVGNDHINITGGKIEFSIYFNYSTSKIGPDQFGYGFTSVFSDIISFTKQIKVNFEGKLQWVLRANSTSPINIKNNFIIKRTQPDQVSDAVFQALNQTLNDATAGVSPADLKTQIIGLINDNLTSVLNQTLTQESIFKNQTSYTFNHPVQGPLAVNISNNLYQYKLSDQSGFILEYLSAIKGESTKDCTVDIPEVHEDYDIYGGIQSVHSMDFYKQVARYNLKNKWLDITLDSSWDSNAFQFYAGDLFEIIPKVAQTIPPRTKLGGACSAVDDQFFNLQRAGFETLRLSVRYSCYIETTNIGKIRLTQFTLDAKYIIQLTLQYETISFRIKDVSGVSNFKSVGDYIVADVPQAAFKVNQGMKSEIGQYVFGTGFPAWPRDLPQVEVRTNYIFFYDSSHIPHLNEISKEK